MSLLPILKTKIEFWTKNNRKNAFFTPIKILRLKERRNGTVDETIVMRKAVLSCFCDSVIHIVVYN